jgi:phosphopentomutase
MHGLKNIYKQGVIIMKFKRVFMIIMDSVGAGELPDAKEYNDEGSNTIGNIAKNYEGFKLPNLEKLGLGKITDIKGVSSEIDTIGSYTKAAELSVGKDTMTGHWEIMGLHITKPFQVFTDTGFPKELLDEITRQTGRGIIGNKSASGTAILDELGEEHMKTGDIIVYTSADSVLQIAAHEEIVPIEELWDICKKTRAITMKDEWKVGRIIARPFLGPKAGEFERTSNRHDYALSPFGPTVMNHMKDAGLDVIALGKINDIYNTEGITEYEYTTSNDNGMEKLVKSMDKDFTGLSYLNLVDFDAKFGHRRNVEGYAEALMTFDDQLTEVLDKLNEDDLLLITADHGNDPTHPGTDHTREYIPVVVYSKSLNESVEIPVLESFADIGATIADNFGVKAGEIGQSFLNELK